MSAHDFFDWLDGLFGRHESHDSGWQRGREQPQETGAYELGDLFKGIANGQHWDGPPGSLLAARRTQAHTPIPPTPQDTGETPPRVLSVREVAQRAKLSEIETLKNLAAAPEADWLHGLVNGSDILPVRRISLPLPGQVAVMKELHLRQETAGFQRLNDMIASLPAALPPGVSEPSEIIYDLPTMPPPAHAMVLDPMDPQQVAAVDQTASAILPSAIDLLATLANKPPDDDTAEVPAYMRQKHVKESE